MIIPALAASEELGTRPRLVGTAQDAAAPASGLNTRVLQGVDAAGGALVDGPWAWESLHFLDMASERLMIRSSFLRASALNSFLVIQSKYRFCSFTAEKRNPLANSDNVISYAAHLSSENCSHRLPALCRGVLLYAARTVSLSIVLMIMFLLLGQTSIMSRRTVFRYMEQRFSYKFLQPTPDRKNSRMI